MYFPALPSALLLTLALRAQAASSDDKTKELDPCTVVSPGGNFYDLRSLLIQPPSDKKKVAKGDRVEDWYAKGWDYNDSKSNFTLNICAPLAEEQEDFEGINKSLWKNVSAYYELESKKYSIG